jgi:hypothetical protein
MSHNLRLLRDRTRGVPRRAPRARRRTPSGCLIGTEIVAHHSSRGALGLLRRLGRRRPVPRGRGLGRQRRRAPSYTTSTDATSPGIGYALLSRRGRASQSAMRQGKGRIGGWAMKTHLHTDIGRVVVDDHRQVLVAAPGSRADRETVFEIPAAVSAARRGVGPATVRRRSGPSTKSLRPLRFASRSTARLAPICTRMQSAPM